MIKMDDFIMMMASVIEHNEETDWADDITLVTGLPKSGKTTLIEHLSNKDVDFNKEYQPTQSPIVKFADRHYVCECSISHLMMMRMSLAFFEEVRCIIIALDLTTMVNASAREEYLKLIGQIEEITRSAYLGKTNARVRTIQTNRDKMTPQHWEDIPSDFYNDYIFPYSYQNFYDEDDTEKKMVQNWLNNTITIDSIALSLNKNDEVRQQFEQELLPYLEEQTEKLIKNHEKLAIWKFTLAICNLMKTGGPLQAHSPALLKAVEKFEEQYHLLTTTLDMAVRAKKTDALAILIRNNIDVNQKYVEKRVFSDVEPNVTTALYEAVLHDRNGNEKDQHVKLLLDAGADAYQILEHQSIFDTDKTYKTSPLDCALDHHDEVILKVFLENSVDINKQYLDKAGETYFTYKLRAGSARVIIGLAIAGMLEDLLVTIKLMLDHGADVNQIDYDGVSALMHVATLGDVGIVKEFIAKGASKTLHHLDKNGLNVLMYATSVPVAKFLMSQGAEVTEEMLQSSDKASKKLRFLSSEMRDFYYAPFAIKRVSDFIVNLNQLIGNEHEGLALGKIFLVAGLSGSGKTNVTEFITTEWHYQHRENEPTRYLKPYFNRKTGWLWECPAQDKESNHYAHMSPRLIAALSEEIKGIIVVVDVRSLAHSSFIKDYTDLMRSIIVEHLFDNACHDDSIVLAITHSDTLSESFFKELPAQNLEFYNGELSKYKHFMMNVSGEGNSRSEVLRLLENLEPVDNRDMPIEFDDNHRKQFEKDFLIYLRASIAEIKEKRQKTTLYNRTLFFCELMGENGKLEAHDPQLLLAIKEFFTQYHLLTSTLSDAVHCKSTNVLKLLIDNDVDVNEPYQAAFRGKTTALLNAVYFPTSEHSRLLLKAGADPYARIYFKEADGTRGIMTPFKSVLYHYRACQIDVYVEFGVNVNAQYLDEVGVTYFSAFLRDELPHRVFLKDVVETTEAMLKHGANVNHINPDGASALMYVARSGNESLMKQFLAKKAIKTIHHTDENGRNVLCYAGSVEMARLLMVFGATMNEDMLRKYEEVPFRKAEIVLFYKDYLRAQAEKSTAVAGVVRVSAADKTTVNNQEKKECRVM
jgi:ankyrin repeat protein